MNDPILERVQKVGDAEGNTLESGNVNLKTNELPSPSKVAGTLPDISLSARP